jgi:hypothetical protein
VGRSGASLVVDFSAFWSASIPCGLMSSTRLSAPKSVNACAGMGGDAREDVGQPRAVHLCGMPRSELCRTAPGMTSCCAGLTHGSGTARRGATALSPNMHSGRFSDDSIQSLLAKHVRAARETCPSLKSKRVSPHVLRGCMRRGNAT